MPGEGLDGEFFNVVPAKSDVAHLEVTREVEGEDALIEDALLVGKIDEKVWAIVTNLHGREAHQSIGNEGLEPRALPVDAKDVHIGDADRLAEEA
eukprot:CAMPEP_0170456034 /NCGR_PEP_ID=MMETSP0123-20130129/3803_1 /TAXON_ID=182087 /ORGANISM="Favella ehrenbergii, Strain Fehren 1" /LENGTH=94 /DNA_ID=CAMNT_0010719377 /DNA_START=626 /DNA_END=910 /DNA_ORIENTATION=-